MQSRIARPLFSAGWYIANLALLNCFSFVLSLGWRPKDKKKETWSSNTRHIIHCCDLVLLDLKETGQGSKKNEIHSTLF